MTRPFEELLRRELTAHAGALPGARVEGIPFYQRPPKAWAQLERETRRRWVGLAAVLLATTSLALWSLPAVEQPSDEERSAALWMTDLDGASAWREEQLLVVGALQETGR